MLVGLGLMMEIGHDERLRLTGQVMLCGVGREQKGLKNPRCAASTGAQGRRNAELWEMFLQTMPPHVHPRASLSTGNHWASLGEGLDKACQG